MKKYLLIFLFLIQWKSYSQNIIYTDIIPDITLTPPLSYDLDLNNDAIIDFTIFYFLIYNGIYFDHGDNLIVTWF